MAAHQKRTSTYLIKVENMELMESFSCTHEPQKSNLISDYVSKACAPSPAKSESELAPRLHKRVQLLQNDLASREIQLKTWQQKVAKLEEQLVLARKSETKAIERQAMAEQRACRLRNNETEVGRLKKEALLLRTQLKDSRDVKACWITANIFINMDMNMTY